MIGQKKDHHGNPEEGMEIDEHDSFILNDIEKPDQDEKSKLKKNFPDKYANTSPLAILGFGMATVLLNLANAGCYEINGMVLGMGFFYGGFGQLIAGIFEILKGHTFAATTALSSTCFWFAFVTMWLCPFTLGCVETNNIALATFNLVWGIFTTFMMIVVLKNGRISNKIQFVSLTINFFLISIGLYIEKDIVVKIGGVFGVISGSVGIYNGCADIVNSELHHNILPF